MKKSLVLLVLLLSGLCVSAQQKFAYVNSEYILKHMPEYRSAQKQLDELSATWQAEADKKYEEIDNLYKSYHAEQVLLTEEMRKKREDEIVNKEKLVKEFQKIKFGYDGELSKKRTELIKPVQDKVFDAIQKYSDENSYGIIFDKASGLTMLYASPKLDKSDEIVVKLGHKPGEFADSAKEKTATKKK